MCDSDLGDGADEDMCVQAPKLFAAYHLIFSLLLCRSQFSGEAVDKSTSLPNEPSSSKVRVHSPSFTSSKQEERRTIKTERKTQTCV